jgi:Fe-S cluster biosynthesis and repair protein YggX
MTRMVNCVKLDRELPGLERPPYPGELGKRIYDNVSQQAWDLWREQATLLINHYGLSLADPQAQDFLKQQMEEFLFGGDDLALEGGAPDVEPAKGARRKK